jgi:hypothetical protein
MNFLSHQKNLIQRVDKVTEIERYVKLKPRGSMPEGHFDYTFNESQNSADVVTR